MKNQNRIRRNGITKPAKSQVKIPAEFKVVGLHEHPESPSASPSKLSPDEIAAIDALDLLKVSGSTAIALSTMNANLIKESAKAFAGWEDFDSDFIQAGMLELPRAFANQFESKLSEWRHEVNRIIKNSAPLEGRCRFFSFEMENAVNDLNHLLNLQGTEICNRSNNGAWSSSYFIMERLRAAFDQAHVAVGKLHRTRT